MSEIYRLLVGVFRDRGLRLSLSLLFGVLIGSAYVALNLFSALVYGSVWSLSVTVFYSVVVAIRYTLIQSHSRQESEGERCEAYALMRRVGVLLLFLDFMLAVMMIYTVVNSKVTEYPDFFALSFAAFTVYSFVSGVVSARSATKRRAPIASAAAVLKMTVAFTSVFNLQYSILNAAEIAPEVIRISSALFGTAICLTVSGLAIYLIATGKRRRLE